ncbi:hypothetical protein HMPREF1575_00522, partial [Gardnerella vaginalis JCP7672]
MGVIALQHGISFDVGVTLVWCWCGVGVLRVWCVWNVDFSMV